MTTEKRKAFASIKFVTDGLARYERFGMRYPGDQATMFKICDRIEWLWKWKLISDEEKNNYCDRAIAIMENDR